MQMNHFLKSAIYRDIKGTYVNYFQRAFLLEIDMCKFWIVKAYYMFIQGP